MFKKPPILATGFVILGTIVLVLDWFLFKENTLLNNIGYVFLAWGLVLFYGAHIKKRDAQRKY